MTTAGYSINLGLPNIPETNDEALFYELVKVYNALRLLSGGIDTSSVTGTVAGTASGLVVTANIGASTALVVAKELIVNSTLNATKIENFSVTVNLSVVGINGRDSATAIPANSDIAIYAIYNDTTNSYGLLAQVCTGTVPTSTYTGSYSLGAAKYSILVSILIAGGTTFSNSFKQIGRQVSIITSTVLGAATPTTSYQAVSLVSYVPYATISVTGQVGIFGASVAGQTLTQVAMDTTGIGQAHVSSALAGEYNSLGFSLPISIPQTIYRATSAVIAGQAITIYICSYTF